MKRNVSSSESSGDDEKESSSKKIKKEKCGKRKKTESESDEKRNGLKKDVIKSRNNVSFYENTDIKEKPCIKKSEIAKSKKIDADEIQKYRKTGERGKSTCDEVSRGRNNAKRSYRSPDDETEVGENERDPQDNRSKRETKYEESEKDELWRGSKYVAKGDEPKNYVKRNEKDGVGNDYDTEDKESGKDDTHSYRDCNRRENENSIKDESKTAGSVSSSEYETKDNDSVRSSECETIFTFKGDESEYNASSSEYETKDKDSVSSSECETKDKGSVSSSECETKNDESEYDISRSDYETKNCESEYGSVSSSEHETKNDESEYDSVSSSEYETRDDESENDDSVTTSEYEPENDETAGSVEYETKGESENDDSINRSEYEMIDEASESDENSNGKEYEIKDEANDNTENGKEYEIKNEANDNTENGKEYEIKDEANHNDENNKGCGTEYKEREKGDWCNGTKANQKEKHKSFKDSEYENDETAGSVEYETKGESENDDSINRSEYEMIDEASESDENSNGKEYEIKDEANDNTENGKEYEIKNEANDNTENGKEYEITDEANDNDENNKGCGTEYKESEKGGWCNGTKANQKEKHESGKDREYEVKADEEKDESDEVLSYKNIGESKRNSLNEMKAKNSMKGNGSSRISTKSNGVLGKEIPFMDEDASHGAEQETRTREERKIAEICKETAPFVEGTSCKSISINEEINVRDTAKKSGCGNLKEPGRGYRNKEKGNYCRKKDCRLPTAKQIARFKKSGEQRNSSSDGEVIESKAENDTASCSDLGKCNESHVDDGSDRRYDESNTGYPDEKSRYNFDNIRGSSEKAVYNNPLRSPREKNVL